MTPVHTRARAPGEMPGAGRRAGGDRHEQGTTATADGQQDLPRRRRTLVAAVADARAEVRDPRHRALLDLVAGGATLAEISAGVDVPRACAPWLGIAIWLELLRRQRRLAIAVRADDDGDQRQRPRGARYRLARRGSA